MARRTVVMTTPNIAASAANVCAVLRERWRRRFLVRLQSLGSVNETVSMPLRQRCQCCKRSVVEALTKFETT